MVRYEDELNEDLLKMEETLQSYKQQQIRFVNSVIHLHSWKTLHLTLILAHGRNSSEIPNLIMPYLVLSRFSCYHCHLPGMITLGNYTIY